MIPDIAWMDPKLKGSSKRVTRSMRELCAQEERELVNPGPKGVVNVPRAYIFDLG